MKCLGPVHLVLWVCVFSTPALGKPWEPSTARYNPEGNNTHETTQHPSNPSHPPNKLTPIVNKISTITLNLSTNYSRHSKAPHDQQFYRATLEVERKLKFYNNKITKPVNKTFIKVANSNNNRIPVRTATKHTTTVQVPVKLQIKATTTSRPTTITKKKFVTVKRKIQIHKNFTEIKVSARPVVHKIVTRWQDKLNASEVKQSWYDVPPANPQPEIISYSPEFPINNAASTEASDSVITPSSTESSLSNPISQFNLDVLPSSLGNAAGGGDADCPTVHISSAMLTPLQRQGCSDISVVLNSHFHQAANAATQRIPTAENDPLGGGVEAVEADPGIEEAVEAPAAEAPLADPPAAADPAGAGGQPAAAAQQPGGGGSQGGGFPGLPTLPEAPEFPMLPEFDLKGMMDFLGWIGGGLGHLLRVFKNPWLYIIPITLFFLKGFLIIMGLFPWWIPGLVVFAGIKSKSNVSYYKHVHPPVYHPDGWFWNHNTKTWENVADYHHHHHRRVQARNFELIPKLIEQFPSKLSENSQSWKRRKKV